MVECFQPSFKSQLRFSVLSEALALSVLGSHLAESRKEEIREDSCDVTVWHTVEKNNLKDCFNISKYREGWKMLYARLEDFFII